MLAECLECGEKIMRYYTWLDPLPCPACGNPVLKILYLGTDKFAIKNFVTGTVIYDGFKLETEKLK